MSMLLVAGVDEAGRGPLAGPVVAAAVILGEVEIAGVGDSKQRTEKQREKLYDLIHRDALAVGVGLAEVAEIDTLNIFHATMLAMQRAVAALELPPDEALIDGAHCPRLSCASRAVVGGDASMAVIGAASIIAKVTRDRIMQALHREYPQYGFARHKGYGTVEHMAALERCGASIVHRRSFAPVRRALLGTL